MKISIAVVGVSENFPLNSLCALEMTLMRRWRYPSLSIHGIEGAFSGQGSKTVIPRKVCCLL